MVQAIGDQMVVSANQAKLRSLVRTMAVADEKTGLLSRSSYLDCLLAEANRASFAIKSAVSAGTLVPNGLPVFHLYYANDDDAARKLLKHCRGNVLWAVKYRRKLATALVALPSELVTTQK